MIDGYRIITLCGSTRFKDAFMEAQKRLTLEGNIVISVGLFGHSGDSEVWDGMDEGTLSKTKEMLDDMHKRKIDMADSIYVINVTQYESTYRNAEKFVLWHNYRMDQVLLKMLSDPDHNQKGTYFYGDEAIVFASLKKDASVEEKLAYKDKFLTANTFQWECENNISDRDLQALRLSKYVHLFIRKVNEEHGVRLPFTYVGEGSFSNERKQEKTDRISGKRNITYLYDIPMKEVLPEYLQYDFGVAI